MEKLRWQNAQEAKLNWILGVLNVLWDSGERKRKDTIIKDIKNIFRRRKEIDNSTIKDITKKKENETIKDRIIRDIKSLFEQENDYYKPIRVGNLWNDSFIEYESNSDKKNQYKNILMKLKPT